MGSHLLEIINKNIDFQKNYIEFELLDTNFSNFAKYISPVVINLENEITELSSIALIELDNELIGYHIRLKSYEDEIAAYALQEFNKTITFERLEYSESFKEKIAAEQIANYEVLQFLVLRVVDIRKRQIIIRKVLGDMAMLGKIKAIDEIISSITDTTNENYKLLAIHPSLKIAVFSCFESFTSVSTQGGTQYFYNGFKIQARNLNPDFTVGEIVAERIIYEGDGQGTVPEAEFEFSSLGDVARLKALRGYDANGSKIDFLDEIVDFGEYGLALSPNWQGVTLDIIESRA